MIGDPFTREHFREVCKPGQGAACCRYLTASDEGYCCEKHSSLKALIDAKVARGEFRAVGDNCEGRLAVLHDD